jgi:hypothetical protein
MKCEYSYYTCKKEADTELKLETSQVNITL